MRTLLAAVSLTFAAFAAPPAMAENQTAIVAGGCFWCVESDFDQVPGVVSTVSGYSGGALKNPTYENHEGHREVVQITFDPAKISYAKLLDVFWHSVDPTDGGGQFCDRGHAYTTAVYTNGAEQAKVAAELKAEAAKELGKSIKTEVAAAGAFWKAEGYHQDYYNKNPIRYRYYRSACGRDGRVEEVWGKAARQGIPSH